VDALPAGTLIGSRYVVEDVIGRGGMAVVYRVRHQQLDTQHALKVLTITATSVKRRLMQEGRVQAALGHPNIVAVTDTVDVGGAMGLVMEYIRGPCLDDFLRARKLSNAQIDALSEGILDAVETAHAHGLIHRDLKPANVMLALTPSALVPKVTDFGLVKMLADEAGEVESRTRAGVTMGTPHYMAPEQIRDAKNVDERADVFSLGAILYELVTGVRCFSGSDTLDILNRVAEGVYTPVFEHVPDAPERCIAAIGGALEVDADRRIKSVTELKAIWFGSTQGPAVGPWGDDLLSQAEGMGAGGSSTRDFLKRSFSSRSGTKGGLVAAPTAVPFSDVRQDQALTAPANQTIGLEDMDFGEPHRATLDANTALREPITSDTLAPRTISAETLDPHTLPEQKRLHDTFYADGEASAPAAPARRRMVVALALLLVLVFAGLAGVAFIGVGAWTFGRDGGVEVPVEVQPEPPVVPAPEPLSEPLAPTPDAEPVPEPALQPTPQGPPEPSVEPEPADLVSPPPVPVAEPDDGVAEVDPEPAPPVRADPPVVTVEAPGVTVSLRDARGRPLDLAGEVAEGSYELFVFWEPREAVFIQEVYLKSGWRYHIKCLKGHQKCTVKPL